MTTTNLDALCANNSIVDLYEGEMRDWWINVNEDDIYRELDDPAFDAFVNEICQDAIYGYPSVDAC